MIPGPSPEDYLRKLFECAQTGILVANDNATYVDANASACHLLGAARDQIIGRTVADFIRPGHAPTVEAQWRAFLRDGRQSGMFELRRQDGSYQTVTFHAEANFVPGFHCSFLMPAIVPPLAADPVVIICAWTKRVFVDREWMSLEDYFARVLGKSVSHGISPEAYRQFFQAPGGTRNESDDGLA